MARAATRPECPDLTEQSHPFLLTDYAHGDVFGAKPTLIKDRWIYILERQAGQPVKLHLEVRADKDGRLSQVLGDHRRFRERKSKEIKPVPIDAVSMPNCVQGRPVLYFLLASPTQLTVAGIARLEQAAPPPSSPDWINLRQPPNGRVFTHPKRHPVLVVTDPLAIACALHSAYEIALDKQLAYVMPPDGDDDKAAETIRARVLKYQLARMIALNLLPNRQDPFNVRKELADRMGDAVFRYVEEFEEQLTEREQTVCWRAEALIAHLQSRYWRLLGELHAKDALDNAVWLNLMEACIHRLGSCQPGMKYFAKVYADPPPELELAGLSAERDTERWKAMAALGARKAAAGIVGVWAEIVPSAIVMKKVSVVEALERIDEVWRYCVASPAGAPSFPGGPPREYPLFGHRRVDTRELHNQIVEIKAWTKEVEGRWVEETEGAQTARVVTNWLRVFELINLAMKIDAAWNPNANSDELFDARCDLAGAALDTLAAFEDALKPELEKLVHSEALAGFVFKFAGAVSSFLDVVVFTRKMAEAREEGKTELGRLYGIARGGAVLGVVGGGLHAGVVFAEAESGLAVSIGIAASALCLGSVAFAITVNLMIEGRKKSVFQRFINHSTFGEKSDDWPKADWVFGESLQGWTDDPKSLRAQINTLARLFAAFEVKGHTRSGIEVRLGVISPGAKLAVTFNYDSRSSYHPAVHAKATIDLFAPAADAILDSDDNVVWQLRIQRSEKSNGRPTALTIGAQPRWRTDESDPLAHCTCDVQLILAEKKTNEEGPRREGSPEMSVTEGKEDRRSENLIPSGKPLHYVIGRVGGMVNREPKSSLPEPA